MIDPRTPALVLALTFAPALAWAQGHGKGLGSAPREARAVIARAVEAMGGKKLMDRVTNAGFEVKTTKQSRIKERHTLKLDGRVMHYASRRASGAGFDVVVGGGQAFLCDRNKTGAATYVQDLTGRDAQEGAYERDILFMPFLLPLLLEKNARMDYRGKNSKGDHVIRALIEPPARAKHEKRFVIRLLFDHKTHLLRSAMGIVPWGHDKGKKRYCEFRDYKPVRSKDLRGTLKLPHTISDQRGKGVRARTFGVSWKINQDLPPSTFVRPTVAPKKKTKPKD